MADRTNLDPGNLTPMSASNRAIITLLVIPFLVYIAWLMETFLFEGKLSLFRTFDPLPFILYTFVGCILIGTIVPVFLIQRSFLSRSVNMFQIGFRLPWRTLVICTLTAIACIFTLMFFGPSDISRPVLFALFLLCLPTGIASVMVCWVLVGTHLQALVRAGGMLVAIPTGVAVTSILFGLTSLAHTPAAGVQDPLVPMILLGMVTALSFFALRDVYASVMVITTGMVLLFPARTDTTALAGAFPLVALCALAAFAALLGIHVYFSRRFATVIVVPDP
jgi:hypothetical protein